MIIERPTILGVQLTNPYLIPNMQQAYTNLGLSSSMATITNLYVRFLPNSVDQLAILDSTLEAKGLDLFDTPVDYEVTYEGDYYQDPAIPDEQITWQYAVVAPSFQFPAGIQYETLAQIHIPGDDYTAVETEAERLASLQDTYNVSKAAGIKPDIADECLPCQVWDPRARRCVKIPGCGGSNPPPAPDAAVPAGYIKVHDTQLTINADVAVRNVRVVARRWFKEERTYTDNSGHFQFTKRFKHSVRILVKFKNDFATVRSMRVVRLWQMLFPVKKTVGLFSGDKTNIIYIAGLTQTFAYILERGNVDVTVSNKSTRYWAAATTINSVEEYRDYAAMEGIGMPSTGIKILLSNLGGGNGSTPMFAKRASNDLPAEFVTTFMTPVVQIISGVILILKHQVDIVGSYNFGGFYDLTSDAMKELFYHELTHCAQYEKLGNSWYTTFVNSELIEVISNVGTVYSPYGDGSNSQSALVALGEGWAYHIGHFFTDKQYGITYSSNLYDNGQQAYYYNGIPTPGLSSHLNLLENFNPNSATDPFNWIPTGLFYDLFDPANETNFPVADQVSGYTNAQMFSTLQSNIYTLQDYRASLLQTVSNPTSSQVTSLFAQYHY